MLGRLLFAQALGRQSDGVDLEICLDGFFDHTVKATPWFLLRSI